MRRIPAVCAAALAVALSLAAAAVSREEDAPKASVDDLAWLAGRWEEREGAGSAFEEWWLPPAGKTMAAVSRQVEGGATKMYELSAIEADGESLVLVIRHFGAGLAPWKSEAAGAGRWRLVEAGKRSAAFEDPVHDFPRRIAYAAGKGDTLEVTLEGERDGHPSRMQFTFRRAK